jgi:hypothetical protein
VALGPDRADEARRRGEEPRNGRDELGARPRDVREERDEGDEPRWQERDEPERPVHVGISRRSSSQAIRANSGCKHSRQSQEQRRNYDQQCPSHRTGYRMGVYRIRSGSAGRPFRNRRRRPCTATRAARSVIGLRKGEGEKIPSTSASRWSFADVLPFLEVFGKFR